MLLVPDNSMSDILGKNISHEFYVLAVDEPTGICLEVLQADSSDVSDIYVDDFTTNKEDHPLSQQPGQQSLDSPASPQDCDTNSPSGSSDSGKPYKPQYTAELEVLCRICGDRASGFHYGVHSCEGCKGFFRRTLKKKLVYKPCQAMSRCKIESGTRNKCQYCRYQRCLYAGMSQDAVRFGRMPKVEREKLLADREELTSTSSRRIVELRTLTDLIKAAFRDTFGNTVFFSHQQQHGYCHDVQHLQHLRVPESSTPCHPFTSSQSPSAPSSPSTTPAENFVLEPADTLDSLTTEQFHSHRIFRRFQELTLPVMEGSVRFAKKIPGFASLAMKDQIMLMKQNGFMVAHLALHSLVTQNFLHLDTQDGCLRVNRNSYHICEQMVWLLGRAMITLDKIHTFALTVGEIALFSAVLLTQDCQSLSAPHQVEELQANLIEALRLELKHNHPKEKVMLAKLLMLVPDLSQIVEQFSYNLRGHVFDPTPNYIHVMPLLKEIFDLDNTSEGDI